jgi:hypothetical protein
LATSDDLCRIFIFNLDSIQVSLMHRQIVAQI